MGIYAPRFTKATLPSCNFLKIFLSNRFRSQNFAWKCYVIIIFHRETLEENNTALEQERKLNVELLYSIFPADIAENLWLGKQVQAKTLSVSVVRFGL